MEPPGYTPSSEGTSSYSQAGPSGTSSYFPSHPAGPGSNLDAPMASQQPYGQPAAAGPNYPQPAQTSSGEYDSISAVNPSFAIPDPAVRGKRGGGRGRAFRARGRGRGRGGGRGGGYNSNARASTRISARAQAASKVQKLKLSFKGAGPTGEGGRQTSFLGEYDRELDEDPEDPLAFEEQFILRVPKEVADGPNGLREMVKGKGKGLENVEFKFLDPRRAAFKFNGVTYSSKLVDLPNIIESQKTFDNRHLFKVADISQMLVVDHPVSSESSITSAPLKIEEYIWPHGITPPLRHVRKRRFRQRLSRRTIEVVEEQVEDLVRQDDEADTTSFDLVDANPDPDVSDQYYIDYDPSAPWQHDGESEFGGSEMYEDPGSVAPSNGEWADEGQYDEDGEEYDEDEEEEEAIDPELAAALMEGMQNTDESGSEDGLSASEDDDDEDADKEDEDDEETSEKKAKIKQFTSEIKALETVIEKKRAGFTKVNAIMEKRFQETIKGLEQDIQTKVDARQVLIDELEEVKAGRQQSQGKKGDMATPGEDGDIDMDADGEDESANTPATVVTPGMTPLPKSSERNTDESGEDEEEEDLFGDDEDEQAATPAEGEAEEEEEDEGEGEGDEDDQGPGLEAIAGRDGDGEGEEDDEMARMLQDELGSDEVDMMALEQVEGLDEQAQMDATAALNDFAMLGGLDEGSPSGAGQTGAGGTGFIEGGVGMRRLASGIVGVDDDDDSGSSSDSD